MRLDAASPEIIYALKKRRETLAKRGRPFKLVKPRFIQPRQVERFVVRALRERYKILRELLEKSLINRLEYILDLDKAEKPRLDALGDELYVIIGGIKIAFERLYFPTKLRDTFKQAAEDTNRQNNKELNKTMKTLLGVELFKSEPWLKPQMQNFVEQNVALIKSVDETLYSKVQESVFRGARTGASVKQIAREIRESTQVPAARAEFIARDQVQKFNGQLSELRQKDLGISRYVWRTALDERVRPDHADREGQIFSWEKPPGDGHPGEAINCRCYAEPVIEDLIE